MKKFLILMVLEFFLIGILSSGTHNQNQSDKIKFRFCPKKGTTYKVQAVINQKIAQVVLGQKFDINQEIKVDYIYSVKKISSDRTVLVKIKYDSIYYTAETLGDRTEYDSSSTALSTAKFAEFDALIGKSFTVVLFSDGSVKDVKGSALDTLIDLFGFAAQIISNQQIVYPEESFVIGDSWTSSLIFSDIIPLTTKSLFTFSDYKDGMALISLSSVMKPETEPFDIEGFRLYNFSGKQTGFFEIEEATGLCLYSEFVQESSGEARVKVYSKQGIVSQVISYPVSLKSGVIVKMFKK